MRIHLDVDADRFTDRLEDIARRASDLSPMGETFRTAMLRSGQRRFATRPGWRGTDGKPRTLVKSGTLRAALTRPHAPGQRLQARRNEVIFGLARQGPAYYGHFLHPRFRLIGLSRSERSNLSDDILDRLMGTRG